MLETFQKGVRKGISLTFDNEVGVVGDPGAPVGADDTSVATGAALRRVAHADGGREAAVVDHPRHHQGRVFAIPLLRTAQAHAR